MSAAVKCVGIDHGTTNSALALMDARGLRVVKVNGVDDVMPSVVYVDKTGRMIVGHSARRAMLVRPPQDGNGYGRYKRRIGQDDKYEFPAAGRSMTAPELGAAVIRELLKAYREESGADVRAGVITIPAQFELNAIEGTRAAARMAGLSQYPVLQEPIAAALAYGLEARDVRANWLVFDLGGGTLDISLVSVRDGKLEIPPDGHIGDSQLGGSNFDRELLDFVLGPRQSETERYERFSKLQAGYRPLRKEYGLESFSESSDPVAWNRLLLEVEEARIRLSTRDEAVVEVQGVLCRDESGKDVKVEAPVTREIFERLIATYIEKAVFLCHALLSRNRLSANKVDRMILVGGPTKTPAVQQALRERLKIPLDATVDPMTAVALGAALYATTVDVAAGAAPATGAANALRLNVQSEPSSRQPRHPVIAVVEGDPVGGGDLAVEFKRNDGGWASGPVPVGKDGLASAELLLVETIKPHLNAFTTTVFDRMGQRLTSVDGPQVWHPPATAIRPPLANSLRVAIAGNSTRELVRAGALLPTSGRTQVTTARLIRRGSAEDVLHIPVVQSVTHLLGREDDRADCAVHVGSIRIAGNDERMTGDLPKGSQIDLQIKVNESCEITLKAYVPLLDAEFEASFSGEPFGVGVEQLASRFDQERERLDQVRRLLETSPAEVVQALEAIDRLECVKLIQQALQQIREGDKDARSRALKNILELSGALNVCWRLQTPARVSQRLHDLRGAARSADARALEALEPDVIGALNGGAPPERLEALDRELELLDCNVRRYPYFRLVLRVLALGGMKVNARQHEIFNQASELHENLVGRGAPETLTREDLSAIERQNKLLEEAYPDLDALERKYIEDNPNWSDMAPATDVA